MALLGAVGLGVDSSRMYQERRSAQAAADHGALTGARLLCTDGAATQAALETLVRSSAAENGFTHAPPTTVVTATRLATGPAAVQVTITSTVSATFSRVLGFSAFDVATDALAGADNCASAAGAGTFGAVYAGGNNCTTGGAAGFEVGGSNTGIYGGTHTNSDFKLTGANHAFHELTAPDIDDPVTYKGGIQSGGTGHVFQVGYPLDLHPSMPLPAPVWPTGWAPTDVTGGVTDPPAAGSMLRRYYDIAAANGTNAADDTLFTDKVTEITKDGVYFTTSPQGMDITRVDGARNVVLVAPNGSIKITANGTVLSALTDAQLDLLPNVPASLDLPRAGILMLSTAPKVGRERCSDWTISMTGTNHRWSGIMWAPTGLVEITGQDNAGVDATAIGWAVRVSGNSLTLRASAAAASQPVEPSIVLIQ